MKVFLTLIVIFLAKFTIFSQSLVSNFQHVSAGKAIIFSWSSVLSGCSIDFDDGSARYFVNSPNGSVTHTYKLSSVYYVKFYDTANGILIKTIPIQVSNCAMEIYDVGASGNFPLDYCNLVGNGYCTTSATSKNSYEYWSTQSLIRCFPMSADSCILEMRCKLSRLPEHYLCLDVGLFLFGAHDVGLVHFFDNASCLQYYSFGVGSDKEQSSANISKMLKQLDGEWITVRLKKEGDKLTSYFNGIISAEYYTNVSLGQLWGIKFVSKGRTEFDYIKLEGTSGTVFYQESYDNCSEIVKKSENSFPLLIKVDSSKTFLSCDDSSNYVSLSAVGRDACNKFTLDGTFDQDFGLFKDMKVGMHNIKVADVSNCNEFNYPFEVKKDYTVLRKEQNFEICEGDTISWNGKIYSTLGTFYDTIRSQSNCDSIIYNIQLLKGITCDSTICAVKIPNVFTPNGDQLNDIFEPISTFDSIFEISIFDRWGNIVFHEQSNAPKWNGEKEGFELISDIYTYIISGYCWDGRSFSQKGEVLLLR